MKSSNAEWSNAEKKIARRTFEAALEKALTAAVADFKVRAAAVSTPLEMWAIGDDLHRQRREIDRMFDYRYSQLTWVFAELIHKGFVDEAMLAGLAEPKWSDIHHTLSFLKCRDGAAE